MAVQLADVFTNNMVFQQGKPIHLWGTGQPGEKISIKFDNKMKRAVVDSKGNWKTQFPSMTANATAQTLKVSGNNKITLDNILVGEVWLCGGQSNMQASFYNLEYESKGKTKTPEDSNYPQIRFYTTPCKAWMGQEIGKAEWQTCNHENALNFSAVAFFFARSLHKKLDVPVGIIVCSWGGTYAESWMSTKRLNSFPDGKTTLDKYNTIVKSYDSDSVYENQIQDYQNKFNQWIARRDKGENPGQVPEEPIGPKYYRRPAGLYYTMLKPLVPYTIKGFVFYQGESNVVEFRSYQYRFILSEMIKNWREDFAQGDIPFLNVQLPCIDATGEWAEIRESQWVGLKDLKNTGLVPIVDLGDYHKNWHPEDKEPVGERLALLARGLVYQERGLEYTGPIYRDMKVNHDKVILSFDHVGTGLFSKSSALTDFQVCDTTGIFVPAEAEIVGINQVQVYSKEIKNPIAVRYGWFNYFTPSLFNKEDLPAMPFRTDKFVLKTQYEHQK